MSYWARLVYGHRYLDLATTPYDIGIDFSPPPLNRSVTYAGVNSQGIDGAKRIGEKYNDRAWSVSFRVLGDTETECNQALNKIDTFLENARNTRFKLYFEYYPQAATKTLPIYGQGVYRYHIKDAYTTIGSSWTVRDQYIGGVMNCVIAPAAEGIRQRLATAKGHIYEATIRTTTGESRGVYVCPPTTNSFINPVFSDATSGTAGWTINGELSASLIKDPTYIPFGDACVKLQAYGTAGTVAYTQNFVLTSGSPYLVSCYVRTMDGHEPGMTEIQLWYGGALGSFTSYHVGDGWYRVYDTFTGTVDITKAGLAFRDFGVSVYATGFQLEPSFTTPTPLVFGDALGCSWDSTRGSSASIGGTAMLRLPISAETVDQSSGAIRMVVKYDVPSTYANNMYFFECDAASESRFTAYYQASSDTIKFNSGGIIVESGTQTFSTNGISVLHFTWGRTLSGTVDTCLYVDGVATVSPDVGETLRGTYLYIGSRNLDSSLILPLRATILDWTVWKEVLSASEISDDYAQVHEWVTAGDPLPAGIGPDVIRDASDNLGNRLNSIPYLWTKDGDDVVDCYYDATHNDWAVAAGIPGNLPAHTIFDIDIGKGNALFGGLLLGNLAYMNYLDMGNTFYGTQVNINVGTVAVQFPGAGTAIEIIRDLDAYRGKKAYIAAVINDAGTTDLLGRMAIHYNTATNLYNSSYTSLDTYVGDNWYLVGPMLIPETIPDYIDWKRGYGELNFKSHYKRNSGSGTVTMDSYRLIAGDILYVPVEGVPTYPSIIIDNENIYTYDDNLLKEESNATSYGDIIELAPGNYNHLNALPLRLGYTRTLTDAITFNRTYVIPRWSTI